MSIPDNDAENATLAAESAIYLRRLQQEQDEAITAIAVIERDIALARINGADVSLIEGLARAKSELTRVALVRNKDVAASMQAANLSMFMRKMDAADTRREQEAEKILDRLGELRNAQGVLQAEFHAVGRSLSHLKEGFAALGSEVALVSAELVRSREHRARLQAAVDALEAQILPATERDRLIAEQQAVIEQLRALEIRLADLEARMEAA